MKISDLEPVVLWKHFLSMTQIPRPSKYEKKAITFLKEFGQSHQLETMIDKTGNVLIKKPATEGFEQKKTIALQSHIDMVPQKNSNIQFNFETDLIQPFIDGHWVTAKDTTLGADNGIGVAAALAVLETGDINHGPIEALFTVDEETGMTGAFGLSDDFLTADIMINLDTEEFGVFCIGCAGGMDTSANKNYREMPMPKNSKRYRISITGLKGGHSGMDINLGRANVNKILFRLLNELQKKAGVQIAEIDAGGLRNAIPREAFAIIALEEKKQGVLLNIVKDVENAVVQEYRGAEDNVSISCQPVDYEGGVMEQSEQEILIKTIYAMPNGVQRMITDLPGVVETSSNLARVEVKNGKIHVLCLLRSAKNSAKQDLGLSIKSALELGGFEVEHSGSYPGWKPDFNSEILQVMKRLYTDKEGEQPLVEVTHGGLECGIIGDKYPGMQMISFGPTIKFPHSPDEKVEINSVNKFWALLIDILAKL
jgi:dipeptidase D